MHIAFISYWGSDEGLAQATVWPHVRILTSMDAVDLVSVITVERGEKPAEVDIDKADHYPLYSAPNWHKKLFDKRKVTAQLEELHSHRHIDFVIARTSLAGWLGLRFCERHKIPYSVESFEPHAAYMLEADVWSKLDPRYRLMRLAEKRQKEQATYLLPVTMRYAEHLIEYDGIDPARVLVMPCCVDLKLFSFDEEARSSLRLKLGIGRDAIVGLYTGKLGGIYLENDVIELLKAARRYWGQRFYPLILSPQEEEWKEALRKAGFDDGESHVTFVSHLEVPAYCSTADFAFSLHKPGPSKIGISPIKNGEFLASGLPVVIPEGIGDDSQEIQGRKMGTTIQLPIDAENVAPFERVDEIILEDRHRERISKWAAQKRSFDIVRNHYHRILQEQINSRV